MIGQLDGAAIHGMGYGLSESFEFENSIPKSLKLKDLGLPRFRDLPEIVAIPITDPHPKGPCGSQARAHMAIPPAAPAIVNAIHDAVGVWMRELPVTKKRLLEAIQKKQKMEEK